MNEVEDLTQPGLNEMVRMDFSAIDVLLEKYPKPEDTLIAVLQDIQEAYGYLPQDVLLYLSKKTGIPAANLSGVATFYAQFRLTPPGKYQVMVCMGTACHVNGAGTVAEAVEETLGIPEGETTPDGLFSWEKVACLGCCSLSPVMMINGRAYGKLTADSIGTVFADIRAAEQGGAQ